MTGKHSIWKKLAALKRIKKTESVDVYLNLKYGGDVNINFGSSEVGDYIFVEEDCDAARDMIESGDFLMIEVDEFGHQKNDRK